MRERESLRDTERELEGKEREREQRERERQREQNSRPTCVLYASTSGHAASKWLKVSIFAFIEYL